MNTNFALTIGRQLGSGGKKIGEILSEKLGIPCYDKELILLASQKSGLGKELFEQMDEKSQHRFFSNFFGFRTGTVGNFATNYLQNEMLFAIQSDVIRSLAEKESGIFVGRCADYILRDHPNCLTVFINANPDDRTNTISQAMKISEKEALDLINETDKKRAGYYNYYSNKTWGMSTSYHLCINSSVLGIEETAEFISAYIRSWKTQPHPAPNRSSFD